MPAMDDWLAQLGGGSALMAVIVAFLLGLRHATDPDHLAAVSTLVLSEQRDRAWRAGALGLAWGLGHAATLVALGLPIVLFGHHLPEPVHQGAEFAVGIVIIVLAARLLRRWGRGHFHSHPHTHGKLRHTHPHLHEHGVDADHPAAHEHRHLESLGRSPFSAFGIGLVHGIGGSAGAGILLVTAAGERPQAAAALLIFALGTALSMALVSGAFGYALARGPVARTLTRAVPVFALLTLLFGVWYALGAIEAVPYAF
jgi:cytochrome c biogenesis protein CcdA